MSAASLPQLHLAASAKARQPGILRPPVAPDGDPPIEALVAAFAAAETAWGVTIAGGEPTLRPDLPALIGALVAAGAPRLGLWTDGLALAQKGVADHLAHLGLRRVTVGMHGARAGLHDWLVGRPGALARTRRGVQRAAAAGLRVEIECVVTRPLMLLLDEVVALAAKLGAESVHFVLAPEVRMEPADFIMLSPRYGLIEPNLEAASTLARRLGIGMTLEGAPTAVARRVSRGRRRVWLGATAFDAQLPGGISEAYARRFGVNEVRSSDVKDAPFAHPESLEGAPQGRGGAAPATRVAIARQQADKAEPTEPRRPTSMAPLRVHLDPDESSRTARMRLVRASQENPEALRLDDPWLTHAAAAHFVRDACRLGPVQIVGPLDGLERLPRLFGRRGMPKNGPLKQAVAVLHGLDADSHDAAVGREGAFARTGTVLAALEAAGVLVDVVGPVTGDAVFAEGARPVRTGSPQEGRTGPVFEDAAGPIDRPYGPFDPAGWS